MSQNVEIGDTAQRRYANAPRLPPGDAVDIRTLLSLTCPRVEIEIGPGRGGFLIERLIAREDVTLLGFELKRKWAVIVNERLARAGLADRGVVFAEDARLALPRLGPDGAVAAMFLHFPDPWWKKKHQKRLVLAVDVLDQIARLLGTGGELFIQTDVAERAARYEAQVLGHACFEPLGESSGVAHLADNPYQGRSHRERRALEDQIPIYRLRFRRRSR
jgi:tRNA (guanine-N7-)-methyltransferase